MREYRGKRKDNGEWVCGFYSNAVIAYPERTHFIRVEERYPDGFAYQSYEVDPETVSQYTGLKDKNDKEIFEGDIINDSFGNRKGVIKYNQYIAAYELTDYDGIHLLSSDNSKQFFEVIGDIWSNPDLLGEVRE